ncbi:ABC transporter [Apodospora peruviana]|uniref:ABC transporter n=1 Tax=Apodospora peruviana TaxID=516989 RepID=A0AAE0MAD1_9PEZI|nr:ABC transporter [Apodospora peruviana]
MACIDTVAFGLANDESHGNDCISDFPVIEYEWFFWLSVATAAACVILAIPRVVYLSRCSSIALTGLRASVISLGAKLIASIAFAGLRIGLLVIAIRHPHTSNRLVASTALDFAAACLIITLSPLEHFKSRRPSILLCSFLFLTLVYDVARTPLLWPAPSPRHDVAFTGLFTATVVVEFIFLVLESTRSKSWTALIRDGDRTQSPEETSSILSLGLYSWLNPLLWRGYHELLTMPHLYPLDRAISVDTFSSPPTPEPKAESTETSAWRLVMWLASSRPLVRSVLLPILPRLCLIGFTFCQPFFLQNLLRFLTSKATSSSAGDQDSTTASALVAVTVLTYSGIAISTALYWYYQERFQSLLRGFLIYSIYRKTANIRHVGDGDSAAVTLMGTDVERIYTGLRLIHEVWANAIQIALATWLLQRELGFAFIGPLVIVFMGFSVAFTISRRAVPYQAAWMTRVQARIGVTSSVLGQIKDLRVSGMTTPATALVQQEREEEIHAGGRSRLLVGISAGFSQLPSALAPVLAFAFGPQVLDETRAFTALSFLALLTSPLLVVLQSLPIIAACVACLRRIKVFLAQDEQTNGRLLQSTSHPSGKSPVTGKSPDTKQEDFISVQNASFGWSLEKMTLHNINLSLTKASSGSITFVVGPVASGKSTLCRALLGEVPHAQGSVRLGSDKIAYCDQVPFLFNASITENIVGFSSSDTARYEEVMQATMLAQDLRELPASDRTVIGTKGVSLSGGQRQRIALARALYHDADIMILDDVFSGLDGSTQLRVCHSIFGPDGLIRRRGTTAIICTHSTKFLPYADHVVSLASDGTIADQGEFDIVHYSGHTSRIGRAFDPVSELCSELIKEGIEIGGSQQEKPATTPPPMQIRVPGSSIRPHIPEPPSTTPIPPPTIDLEIYRHWVSTIGPIPLVIYLALVVGLGFCSNFPTIWLKMWSADSVSPKLEHSFAFWMVIYALLGVGAVICVLPAGLIMLRTAVRLGGTHLHHAAINTAMHSTLKFLSNTDVGKILNLFSQDMNILDTQLPRMVNNLCFCLATAAGQAVVIAISSGWLAISYPFFGGLLWVVQRVYLPTSKRLRILDLEAKSPLYTHFLDTIAGLPTIRAFNWFPYQLDRNNALLDDSQRPLYLLAMAQQWLTLTMNVLVTIVAVLLVVLATQLRSADAGNVGAGLVTLITLGTTLTNIVTAYTGLETSLGAISRLKGFEEETEQEENNGTLVPGESWPYAGRILMQNVEASYNGTDKVLKGVWLVIEKGEKVAICGRTGSGKSSILAVLLRLIDPLDTSSGASSHPLPIDSRPRYSADHTALRLADPQSTSSNSSHRILIDNLPLNTVNHTALRERIISASQDQVFLPGGTSFRTNLDPWNLASNEECTAVLVSLALDTLVESKGGLDAPVSSVDLSAGQKQLFSLARAVLRRRVKLRKTGVDGGILLLDEITSSADAETEQRVRKVLEQEFGGYTVVMVTHQQDMAMSCGRVVVIDAGKVVEDGQPDELMNRDGGWFRGLWGGAGR